MDRQRGVGANEMGIWNDEERLGDTFDEIQYNYLMMNLTEE